jgi:hydroxyethylthiazole kinase-like uncharacterized protein yjeF
LVPRQKAALVLDAAALKAVWHVRSPTSRGLIITPHVGEMALLTNLSEARIAREPEKIARDVARRLHAVVVLKGATTVIATPTGTTFRHRAEIPGLGISGSGDVLAGLITGLAAQGASVLDASLWGVVLHARAARRLAKTRAGTGYLARELTAELPPMVQGARAAKTG